MAMLERPKFLESYMRLLADEASERGGLALIPYWFFFLCVAGSAVAYFLPSSFWADDKLEISTAVYAGILSFNGLVLVLGWNAFSRVHDILMNNSVGEFVYKNGLLNDYLVHIDFMHVWQLAAVIFSAAGLISILFDFAIPVADRAIFAGIIISTAYALKQAVDSIRMMNALVWQAAVYEHETRGGKTLTPIDGGKANGSR